MLASGHCPPALSQPPPLSLCDLRLRSGCPRNAHLPFHPLPQNGKQNGNLKEEIVHQKCNHLPRVTRSHFSPLRRKEEIVVRPLKVLFTLPGTRMVQRASDKPVDSVLGDLTIHNSKKQQMQLWVNPASFISISKSIAKVPDNDTSVEHTVTAIIIPGWQMKERRCSEALPQGTSGGLCPTPTPTPIPRPGSVPWWDLGLRRVNMGSNVDHPWNSTVLCPPEAWQ